MQFQKDINNLVAWSIKWELKFNVYKCYILHLEPFHSYGDYYLDGNTITTSSTVKDLGITINSCLKCHDHTSLTITKANRILGLISKIFQYREPDVIVKLHKSLVRPIIEYRNHIWGPYYATDQKLFKRLQRRATKLISSISHYTYQARLLMLKSPLSKVKWRYDFIVLTSASQFRLIVT